MVEGWLKRSEPFPIARLEVRGLKNMPFLQTYLAALVSYFRRWERVSLPLDGHDISFFRALPEDAFPSLRKFNLTEARGDVPDELSRALQSAKKLREMTLDHSDLDASWTLLWPQLDTLSLSNTLEDEMTESVFCVPFLSPRCAVAINLTLWHYNLAEDFSTQSAFPSQDLTKRSPCRTSASSGSRWIPI